MSDGIDETRLDPGVFVALEKHLEPRTGQAGQVKPNEPFASFTCERCGDMVVEKYGRVFGDRRVCILCQQELLAGAERRGVVRGDLLLARIG